PPATPQKPVLKSPPALKKPNYPPAVEEKKTTAAPEETEEAKKQKSKPGNLRRDKGAPTPPRRGKPGEKPPLKEEKTTTQVVAPATTKGTEEKEGEQKPKLAPKPTLKKPPQRPVTPPVEGEVPETKAKGEEEELEAAEELLLEKPKVRKPKQKKGPERTRDEDEEELIVRKEAKKGKKRRALFLDEEEEEELEELFEEEEEESPVLSLALARPPKPPKEAEKDKAKATTAKKPTGAKKEKPEAKVEKKAKEEEEKPPEFIVLNRPPTCAELAEMLKVPPTEIITKLFYKGIAVTITQTLDLETAKMVASELGVEVITEEEEKPTATKTEMLTEADLDNLQKRPPVVTIMGHVDHGKTTLLDAIRKTKVAQTEAGGITQHIGAYYVDVEHEGKIEQIVFLDTPGHEAFTAMRARGAKVTDIAVLVVAADDGVRPQTKEAISHAKAAGVPIVVAINKIDKPGANPERVKQELAELGLVPEEWGGDTVMVPVSALTGENLDTLLEMLLLVAEVEELYANPERPAKGTVLEAHLDRTRGNVATLLVQNGTLRVGDIVVAGATWGKIRAMMNDRGQKVEAAGPSFPVEVLGFNELPEAGDEFEVYLNEKEARTVAEKRAEEKRDYRLQLQASRRVSLSTLSAKAQKGELKELNLILKADVQGSVEAILQELKTLPQEEVQIRVLLSAAGEITETDVDLAAASGAVIIGFNTTLAPGAREAAERYHVDIRQYNIIYRLKDDIQAAMEGLLEPEEVEQFLGKAEVRAVFPVSKGAVAGCYVLEGKVVRNRNLRVIRNGQEIYKGTLDSLRRFKDDVKEVAAGFECGISVDKFHQWQVGDIIEVYEMVFKRRTLSQ
ncbi:MAG TPA: translation initiation factor IF-2, partial [Geminocystis sp. M7585_C2015_104]|nr:translation initiation factor IF-2 [Geminocystis sp. M7585_C2015_104]